MESRGFTHARTHVHSLTLTLTLPCRPPNPYHNRTHVLDVLQSVHALLLTSRCHTACMYIRVVLPNVQPGGGWRGLTS